MKTFDRDYMLTQLQNLLAIDSTSGQYREIEAYVAAEMEKMGYTPRFLRKGGVWCDLGGEGESLCLISHLDDIGLMVRHIYPDGTLKVVPVGGLRASAAEHENVRVYSRKGVYSGTVQRVSPSVHTTPADVYNAPADYEHNICILLDEEVYSAAETRALGIETGDIVALDPHFTMAGDFIKSRFIDDKACSAVLLTLMKYFSDNHITPPRNVTAYFTFYEEILHGGSWIPPQTRDLIALDIAPVGPEQTSNEHKATIFAKDSRFPYHLGLKEELMQAADKAGIDYVVDVFTPGYGTDCDPALQAGYDVRHAAVGHGCRATHGYERTHVDSLRQLYGLLKAYILG